VSVRARGGRLREIGGAVLAGGASSRMGSDKARREVAGVAAATRTARLLASLCQDVLLVGGEPPPDAPGRRVPDPAGPRCALRGLVGALASSRAPRVLVVATDLPLLSPELLLALVAWPEAEVVLPRRDEGLEPLCALWGREAVLPRARARLEGGRLALHELAAELDAAVLEGADLVAADPEGLALANANTPEEWERLAAIARAGS
jgi:molybdopterin-guanine dinucleotide biosynthesis protein A